MRCAWKELLGILPPGRRNEVDRLGRDSLQELRLRLGQPGELVLGTGSQWLSGCVTAEDLAFVINAASGYSPWCQESVSQGYLTAPGGHRIGICGEAVQADGQMTGIRTPTSLCIRVARDLPGISQGLETLSGNLLILGPPGSGKTTLLRDLIRTRSDQGLGSIAVVDSRGELFPFSAGGYCFAVGRSTDVLTGCEKIHGIQIVLKTMGPRTIAVDEITDQADCQGLAEALWCGVWILATAHARGKQDFLSRPVYKPLAESKLFDTLITLRPDKSWRVERMNGSR